LANHGLYIITSINWCGAAWRAGGKMVMLWMRCIVLMSGFLRFEVS
jgi:hypothetical protein